MALGGIMEGLLAAQQIAGNQQEQQYKQALLALNLQNQRLRVQDMLRQRQADALSYAGLMGGAGDITGGPAMPAASPVPLGSPSPAISNGQKFEIVGPPPTSSLPDIRTIGDPKHGYGYDYIFGKGKGPPPGAGTLGPQPAASLPDAMPAGGPIDFTRLDNELWKLESGGRLAGVPDSSAGAIGPMQVMPGTARSMGVDPAAMRTNPILAKQVGDRYASSLFNRYGGNPDLTAIAYNAGPGRADAVARGAPLSSLPSETQNYVAKLHADLGLPPLKQSLASNTAIDVAASVPPAFAGRISLQQIARMVDQKAGPDVPDDVKFAAVANLYKLMAPASQQQFQQTWEAYKFGAEQAQHREEFGIRQQELEAGRAQARELAEERMDIQRRSAEGAHGADWQIMQTPDGKAVRVNRRTGETVPVDLPSGTGKLGTAGGPPASDAEVKYWSQILKNGGSLPPGLSRTAAGAKLVQSIMKEMSASGDPNDFIANHATVQADARSLANMTKMTDAAESFERTANANLDNALRLSQGAVPTDMGPWVNKWVETGETQFGDENVPPYTAAVLTAANEYAKIMNGSTGSQGSTVDSRREAAEMLSPYLSTGQIAEVAKVLKQDMANRKRELMGQVNDIKARLQSAGKPAQQSGGGQGGSGSLDVTPEQYDKMPSGSAYTVPGDPTVRYKP